MERKIWALVALCLVLGMSACLMEAGDANINVASDADAGTEGECEGCEGEGEGEGSEGEGEGEGEGCNGCEGEGEGEGQHGELECSVWLEGSVLCGRINDLYGWTFGCMPPGVEPVCPLDPPFEVPGHYADNGCVAIPDNLRGNVTLAAWPRRKDGGWLTLVGCKVGVGVSIQSDPSGGHYVSLRL